MNIESPNPDMNMALSIADNLTRVVEFNIKFGRALSKRAEVPSTLRFKHYLLKMAEQSWMSELTAMGFPEMAEDALLIGFDAGTR